VLVDKLVYLINLFKTYKYGSLMTRRKQSSFMNSNLVKGKIHQISLQKQS